MTTGPVERAAAAMHAVSNSDPWERQHEYVRQEFRDDARAAFRSIDVDELAAVLSTQTTCDGEPYPSEQHYRLARAVVAHLTKGNENDE